MDATILLVEDDSSIREITKLGLEDAGFAVRTAVDGDEGLARFRREQPDLVVLDVMLPKRDGLEVCRSIRAESSVPVVMLTARSDAIDIVVGLESGADDYVTKPFEMPVLVARIRAALRRAQSLEPSETLTLGTVRIDVLGHRVTMDGEELVMVVPKGDDGQSSGCAWSSHAGPDRCSLVKFSSIECGVIPTWVIPDWSMSPFNVSVPRPPRT